MAICYEDSFALLREASTLIDEAVAQGDSGRAKGQVRVAFYKLYQAANTATMISPPDVRMSAENSEAYRRIVEYPYQMYYRDGLSPQGNVWKQFERWREDVQAYVDDLSARSKLSVVKKSRDKR